MMTEELWRSVDGYEGVYEVSSCGRVRNIRLGIEMKAQLLTRTKRTFPVVMLRFRGRRLSFHVHRLVARAFLGPRPPGYEVNHKDGNPRNPNISNLEYVTRVENMRHARRLGLLAIGERHGSAVLTDNRVREIRRRHQEGESQSSIARAFGVARLTIQNVLNGRCWSHVKEA